MEIRFTNYFSIRNDDIDFFDIPINEDFLAFIDPFLIEKNKSKGISREISKRLKEFFRELNNTYIKNNDRKNGILFLNHLHEPNEFHLGYSSSNKGKAISRFKADELFTALRNNKFSRQGFSATNEAHNVLLLVNGIGQDIMSDIIANTCRDIFSDFTIKICKKHSISTQQFKIEFYNTITKKWDIKTVDLPVVNSNKIILLPKLIIGSKRAYSQRYNWFLAANYIKKVILNSKHPPKGTIRQMKDGTRKAIIKEIYRQYRKPKKDLVDFVVEYPGSLDEFIEYAKKHYPELNLGNMR